MPSKKERITAHLAKNSDEYRLFQQVKEKLQEQRGEKISQTQVLRHVLRNSQTLMKLLIKKRIKEILSFLYFFS
jgi:hypothetical protein